MMYPYADTLMRFARTHPDFTYTDSGDGEKLALVIESRPNFWLPIILRNVMFFLGSGWRLCIVCSPQTEFYVRGNTRGWNIDFLSKLPALLFTRKHYNRMMLDAGFWMQFPEEKIFVFQSDSLLCRPGIEDYLDYDFIGAPTGAMDDDFIIDGGLSLRSRSKMMQALKENPISFDDNIEEDVFYTRALRQAGARLPRLEQAMEFAVKSEYRCHPVGVYGIDKYYHPLDTAMRIVAGINY